MKHDRVLWVEDSQELNEKDRQNAVNQGFDVLQKRNLDLWENYLTHLDDFVAVVFMVTRANCPRVFRNTKAISDHWIASGHFWPIVALLPPPSFLPEVSSDFSLLGCCVMPDLQPAQIFSFLRVLITAQNAIDRNGTPVWQPAATGHPIIFGSTGLHSEMKLEGLQRKIWLILRKHCGLIVFTDDLAEEVGCGTEQIRVHIKRIRNKFALCGRKVGLRVAPEEFIETLDGGYRLNAHFHE